MRLKLPSCHLPAMMIHAAITVLDTVSSEYVFAPSPVMAKHSACFRVPSSQCSYGYWLC